MKKTIRLLGIIALAAVIGLSMAACDSGGGNDPVPQIVTYSGVAGGTTYTLKITENTARYTAQSGDFYELTAGSKKSTGKVNAVSKENGVLTLKPANSETTFKVNVSGDSLTGFTGSVKWDGEATLTQLPTSTTGGSNGGSGGDAEPFSKVYTNMVVIHSTGNPNTETLDFSYLSSGSALSTIGTGDWEAKVTGGTLSLKLGIPSAAKLASLADSTLTVSDRQAKLYMLDAFYTVSTNGQKKRLEYCSQETITSGSQTVPSKVVVFFYVDRDVTVNGTDYEGNQTAIYNNLQAKKGWNTVTQSVTVSGSHATGTYTVGTPDSNLKWRIIN